MSRAREIIKADEGRELKLYKCTAGKLSIGYGRNLEDRGISHGEAEILLDNDIARSIGEAATFPWYRKLDEVRKDVILCMLYNPGLTRFLGFKQLITAMEKKDYKAAAAEMRSSKWAKQVKARAERLAKMMEKGEYV